jgi:predicted RNA-binding Zn-ribbon protein involved in translation (DUF1610 family)
MSGPLVFGLLTWSFVLLPVGLWSGNALQALADVNMGTLTGAAFLFEREVVSVVGRPIDSLRQLSASRATLALLCILATQSVLYLAVALSGTAWAAADEPFRRTFLRSCRVTAALLPTLALPFIGFRIGFKLFGHYRAIPIGDISMNVAGVPASLTLATAVGAIYLRSWIKALGISTNVGRKTQDRTRQCVLCGYDLRFLEHDSRCPECGNEALSRPRTQQQWESATNRFPIRAWLAVSLRVILKSKDFFGSIPAWSHLSRAHEFALLHTAIAAFVSAWLLVDAIPQPYSISFFETRLFLAIGLFTTTLASLVSLSVVIGLIGAARRSDNRQLPATKAACYLTAWLVPIALVNMPALMLLLHYELEIGGFISSLNVPLSISESRDLMFVIFNLVIVGAWLRAFANAYRAMRYASEQPAG